MLFSHPGRWATAGGIDTIVIRGEAGDTDTRLHSAIAVGEVKQGRAELHLARSTSLLEQGSRFAISAGEAYFIRARNEPALSITIALLPEWSIPPDSCATALASSRPPARLERVRELLHAHATRPFCASELASAASMSRFHMHREFRRAFGLAPRMYLEQLRIAKAQSRIAGGTPSLSALAHEMGFADQPHFTRVFRRIVGVTPGAYAGMCARPAPSEYATVADLLLNDIADLHDMAPPAGSRSRSLRHTSSGRTVAW